MKTMFCILTVLFVSNFSYASNKCFNAAKDIAQNFIVPGTSLKKIQYESTKDTNIEKYIVTIQGNDNTSQVGYVVIVISARDCAEIMSIPGF